MKVILDKVGHSEAIKLNEQQANFKVTLVGVAKGFTGTWGIQYSPDNITWLDHEEMHALTKTSTGNLFFNIPYIRLEVKTRTAGSIELHTFQGA